MLSRHLTRLFIVSLFLLTSNISFAPIYRGTQHQWTVTTSAGRNNRAAIRAGRVSKPESDPLGDFLAMIFCCRCRKSK